jgi:hypothetical protein
MSKSKKAERYVVYASDSRPWVVCAGVLEKQDASGVTLRDARQAVYFTAPRGGLFGLATHGPQPGSRISGAAERVELGPKVALLDCTAEARAAWECSPWS